jgi:hypothetical protein
VIDAEDVEIPRGDLSRVLYEATRGDVCYRLGGTIAALAPQAEGVTVTFCDRTCQVRMDAFHAGRVALVGDAAHCPSPVTGQGTNLALVGAYVLATELRASPASGRGARWPVALSARAPLTGRPQRREIDRAHATRRSLASMYRHEPLRPRPPLRPHPWSCSSNGAASSQPVGCGATSSSARRRWA